MSGTPLVKPPRNNAEWARNTEKRQSAVEHPTSQRIGRWVVSEQADTGALIASHVNGGSTVLAQPPEPSDEAGADEVTEDVSVLSLTKTVNQAAAVGTTVITWDDVRADLGGWTSGVISGGLSDITVPISGVYQLSTTLHFQVGGGLSLVGIRINGTTVMVGNIVEPNGGSWPSVVVTGMLPLLSGDIITVVAGRTSAATNVGGSGASTPPSPCFFTAHMVATG